MLRRTWCSRRFVSIDQVTSIVKAKQNCCDAARNVQLIDVRSTAEVAATGMIPFAMNIPLPVLRDVLSPDSILQDDEFEFFFGGARPVRGLTQIVLYCAHGFRSSVACELAEELGFECAGNFSGGWAQWCNTYGSSSTCAAPPESSQAPPK